MFILLGINGITRRRVREDGGGGSKHVKGTKITNYKIYTTWARILSDRNAFCTLKGGEKRRGLMPLGLFLFVFCFCLFLFFVCVCVLFSQ